MKILIILYILLVITVILRLVMQNNNSIKTLLWIMVLLFIPVIGLIFFAFLGRNIRIKNPSINQSSNNNFSFDNFKMPDNSRKLMQLIHNNSGASPYFCNSINVFDDGKATFGAMFDAIENAQEQIDFEFFIFRNDKIGSKMQKLLIKKALQGVKVRIIYDFWGSYRLIYNRLFIKQMKDAGIIVQAFLPFSFGRKGLMFNYRNHRKILLVDSKIGFTGGLNIACRYYYGNRLGLWRDTFVGFAGEAVSGLQRIFDNDWAFAEKKMLLANTDTAPSNIIAENVIQIVHSGPDTFWNNIEQGLSFAIQTAQKFVYIQTPYFVPTETVFETLRIAALSGTEVKVMIATHSDSKILDACSASYFRSLLQAGVRIFKYENGFLHCKTCVIDNFISVVGSANFDVRSFDQNFEINAFIYGKHTADKFLNMFENDLL
ncbi:MAG: cardiolipin synthase, partial [Paludibacter sp.]|nr:cardiolipin synthase [Paludibacter sp.]